MRKLLFSVTKKDLVVETLRGSGPGGQHRNKTETAVRISHPASGATALAQEFRSQLQNKKAALHRLVKTKEFQIWHKLEAAKIMNEEVSIEQWVEKMMKPSLTRVEIKVNGKWTIVDPEMIKE